MNININININTNIELEPVNLDDDFSLLHTIKERRSIRCFSGEVLNDRELSIILWACQGITDAERSIRTAPSAGATYPIELYVVLKTGVYKYSPADHALALHKEGDALPNLAKVSLGQKAVEDAAAVLVLCYNPEDIELRYKERSYRYACLEAGHIAQNGLLAAAALGLGAVVIGAYYDDFVKDVLELKHAPIYMVSIGRKG